MALGTTALAIWILNAIFYAILVCLIFYYAVAPSFQDQGLYTAGTTVFVGELLRIKLLVFVLVVVDKPLFNCLIV